MATFIDNHWFCDKKSKKTQKHLGSQTLIVSRSMPVTMGKKRQTLMLCSTADLVWEWNFKLYR